MMASKAMIATTGHNISNSNTEGYSRQRVQTEATDPQRSFAKGVVGTGTAVSRVERVNDEYIEKQIRNGTRDMANLEEKDMVLKQAEDIFNEMNGDGLNRLVARFYNEFRKLGNEPENEAVRQSVREATQAMANDFRRIRSEVIDLSRHIDSRLDGYAGEINATAQEIRDLNLRINQTEVTGAPANDLQDKRDQALKKLSSYMDVNAHKDNQGNYTVDIRGVGPLVVNTEVEKLSTVRSPSDESGKIENALDIKSSGSAQNTITHQIKGGKLGALLEVRDQTLSTVLDRLDELAFTITNTVNDVHRMGYTRDGATGIDYFKPLESKERASEFISLSDHVAASANNIATAFEANAPGDNRVAIAISSLQGRPIMNDGKTTVDEWYNSIVSDVGVTAARAKAGINQQRDIMTNLQKMRDQVSGVSLDEETANLMQFQHTYDASAKVIQIADEMMKTVLDLKR
jgi:flagellar hook-associated protein 1 FlgK